MISGRTLDSANELSENELFSLIDEVIGSRKAYEKHPGGGHCLTVDQSYDGFFESILSRAEIMMRNASNSQTRDRSSTDRLRFYEGVKLIKDGLIEVAYK